nr:hypothetical protein [Pelagibius sp. Alg239-R121]
MGSQITAAESAISVEAADWVYHAIDEVRRYLDIMNISRRQFISDNLRSFGINQIMQFPSA